MKTLKTLLAGLSLLGIFASEAGAQVVREDHVDPRTISPADPKNLPSQSPLIARNPGGFRNKDVVGKRPSSLAQRLRHVDQHPLTQHRLVFFRWCGPFDCNRVVLAGARDS